MEPQELETLLAKIGGKYKLVTLFQKRMRELQRGLPKLTDADSTNVWDIVSSEVFANKVDLIMGEEADQMRKEIAAREAEEVAENEAKGKKGKGEAKEHKAEAAEAKKD